MLGSLSIPAVIQRQRWPCVVENASCSSVLAPRTCHSLSYLEPGSWGLCCSRAVSSLEFVPRDTHLPVRVTWLSDVQLLLTSQPPNFILISRLLVKIGVKNLAGVPIKITPTTLYFFISPSSIWGLSAGSLFIHWLFPAATNHQCFEQEAEWSQVQFLTQSSWSQHSQSFSYRKEMRCVTSRVPHLKLCLHSFLLML